MALTDFPDVQFSYVALLSFQSFCQPFMPTSSSILSAPSPCFLKLTYSTLSLPFDTHFFSLVVTPSSHYLNTHVHTHAVHLCPSYCLADVLAQQVLVRSFSSDAAVDDEVLMFPGASVWQIFSVLKKEKKDRSECTQFFLSFFPPHRSRHC